MMPISKVLDRYSEIQALSSAISLLSWDRQVLMPPGGAEARSAHVGRLTRMKHQLFVSSEFVRVVEDAGTEVEPGSSDAAMVRILKKDIELDSKLPVELVERKARVSSDAYEVWKKAKTENRFDLMVPYLEELVEIARETAERIGYKAHLYDALIDLYEEGATHADAANMFAAIKGPISALVAEISDTGRPVDDTFLAKNWDTDRLRSFAESAATQIGFDFKRGRLNVAPNAFCSTISTGDVRMTTRASDHIKGIVSSSLHEMGHGLYEQGSPPEWDRTPLRGGVSLGVHESQSRLWENIVGRSRGFWTYFLPELQASFPELADVDVETFFRAINKVMPEFVRVGADELTYNLHILVRFELEVEMLTGRIAIKDLPAAWNAKYEGNLGILPPTDTLGCLQDVHWSRGTFGYFPTYAMGNLIGAQIWNRLQSEFGDTESLMARGEYAPILEWLTARVYSKGSSMTPRDLLVSVTGEGMNPDHWLAYADAKYREIYGL